MIGVAEFPLVAALRVENSIGECVLWDERAQSVFWTDVPARRFWRWSFGADEACSHPLPEALASFALTAQSGIFIGAFESGFARFDPFSGAVDRLVAIDVGRPETVMNDGRVDRRGRFWSSTKVVDGRRGAAAGRLWRLDASDTAVPLLDGFEVPNSLAFSLDGTVAYCSDSERSTIWRHAMNGEDLGAGKPFAYSAPGVKPDGACVDSEGALWVAQWGGGEIVRYAPDGAVWLRLPLPVERPTCVTFGGPALDHLLITSARGESAEHEPLAGALLVYRTPFRGVAEVRCTSHIAQARLVA